MIYCLIRTVLYIINFGEVRQMHSFADGTHTHTHTLASAMLLVSTISVQQINVTYQFYVFVFVSQQHDKAIKTQAATLTLNSITQLRKSPLSFTGSFDCWHVYCQYQLTISSFSLPLNSGVPSFGKRTFMDLLVCVYQRMYLAEKCKYNNCSRTRTS